MEFDPQDQDIIRLLTKLKDVQGEYPEKMLLARRQSYLKRIMELEVGMSGGKAIRNASQNTKPVSTLLETALIVAIVAEASVMAYFYRDKLADFVQTITTGARTEQGTPRVIPTALEGQGITPSPAITSTAATASLAVITDTPINTPIPGIAGDNNNTTPGVSSTPVPNGNNGNHYGQTPKPERTKENNGNNDKPPKDKPTKDKPPKDKSAKTK
ncbi:MAG TPA: hypothetical protein VLE49_16280 [Anaerolineales bacterium]|nr:hypothetical protein [Anaerolineales bacterium]